MTWGTRNSGPGTWSFVCPEFLKDRNSGFRRKSLPCRPWCCVSIHIPLAYWGMASLTKQLLGAQLKTSSRVFPGGPVVKNSPANAGDLGLIPDSGRFHMPRAS